MIKNIGTLVKLKYWRYTSLVLIVLSGCKSKSDDNVLSVTVGADNEQLKPNLLPNQLNLIDKQSVDSPVFQTDLLTPATDPYWVKSLDMPEIRLSASSSNESIIEVYYSFPSEEPAYLEKKADLNGWQPAGLSVQKAALEIYENVSDIVNIAFLETNDLTENNVVAIMFNEQPNTDAYSYFPSQQHSVGSDILIDSEFQYPKWNSANITNYDYEIIVHELGHALGLKHPFAPLEDNNYVLPIFEDRSSLTAMTYTEDSHYFSGNFRIFDYLALVQKYGINANYQNGDDVYQFSSSSATYIIDSGGYDLIDSSMHDVSVFIDLRENSHSYLGEKHQYISSPYQMTISKASTIESVSSGEGDDHIIGNASNNVILSGGGDDKIYAGEGRDLIEPGSGFNVIDVREDTSENDFILFDSNAGEQFNQIFNFEVSGICDVLVFDYGLPNSRVSEVLRYKKNIDFSSFDIYRFDDFNAQSFMSSHHNIDNNKIFLSYNDNSSSFNTELYLFENSTSADGELLHLASISTDTESLSAWSSSNFFII